MSASILTAVEVTVLLTLVVSVSLAGQIAIPRAPEGHPRVYLRPADVAHLKEKAASPEQVRADSRETPISAALVYPVAGASRHDGRPLPVVQGGARAVCAGAHGGLTQAGP
jgi:hypothetical protein